MLLKLAATLYNFYHGLYFLVSHLYFSLTIIFLNVRCASLPNLISIIFILVTWIVYLCVYALIFPSILLVCGQVIA